MKCPICGEEFIPKRSNQPTCGDEDCRRIHKLEYLAAYQRQRRTQEKYLREHREWMREYRRKKKAETKAEPKHDFVGLGYAERQIQQTLAMVGKVKV